MTRKIAILGSTGSIGRQTFSVIESLPGQFEVVSMAAGGNIELAAAQAAKHRPKLISVATQKGAEELSDRLRAAKVSPFPEILFGPEGIEAVATHPDAEIVVSAAVGVVGLRGNLQGRPGGENAGAGKQRSPRGGRRTGHGRSEEE